MKTKILFTLAAGAFLVAGAQAQVRETPVVIALSEGGNPQGYIQNSNDQGVLFATAPGGQGQMIAYSKIRGEGLDKLIRFEERVEALGTPRALFSAGAYNEAAAAFGKVARDYAIILSVPQNFASEALFYQAESLKRAGNYPALATLVKAPVAKTIETKLGERYQRNYEFHKLWALLGENDTEGLATALEAYQEPYTGDSKLLASPAFKHLPATELAELSYLRGKVSEARGEKLAALDDYYRAFTLAYGNDVLLSKLAMGAAMVLQKDDPLLASEDDRATAQMQSIAYMFSKRFGEDTMPGEFQKYAVRPPMARLTAQAQEEPAEGEAAPEGETAPKDGEAPEGGEEKPAEKGKGDAKAKE